MRLVHQGRINCEVLALIYILIQNDVSSGVHSYPRCYGNQNNGEFQQEAHHQVGLGETRAA